MKINRGAVSSVLVSIAVTVLLVYLYRRGRYKVEEGELAGESVITGMETWDSKSDETIKGLHPKIRQRVTDLVNDLNEQGIKYRIYSGFRSFDEQAELYGKGRTATELVLSGVDAKYAQPNEKKVTNAKPGSSYHNYGLAFDGVEIKDGSAFWNSANEQKIAVSGAKYGFYWGGLFTTFKDRPHFEDKQFGTWQQLLALYNGGNKDINGYLIV